MPHDVPRLILPQLDTAPAALTTALPPSGSRPVAARVEAAWRTARSGLSRDPFDVYLAVVVASFGLFVPAGLAEAIGAYHRVVSALAMIGLIGCGHPALLPYLLADAVAGQPGSLAGGTEAAWRAVFCATLAPYIAALLVVAVRRSLARRWSSCLVTVMVAMAFVDVAVWVFYSRVTVAGAHLS